MTEKKVIDEPIVVPKPEPKLIRIKPVPGVYVQGVPAMPMEVDEARAKELLAYTPPAFVKA